MRGVERAAAGVVAAVGVGETAAEAGPGFWAAWPQLGGRGGREGGAPLRNIRGVRRTAPWEAAAVAVGGVFVVGGCSVPMGETRGAYARRGEPRRWWQ